MARLWLLVPLTGIFPGIRSLRGKAFRRWARPIEGHSAWDSLRDKAFPRWFAFCCNFVFLVSILLVARCGASLWLPCHIMSFKTICSIFMLLTLLVVSLCCFILATLSCRVFHNDLFKRSMLVLLAGASCWKLHLFRVLHEGTLVYIYIYTYMDT